MESHQTAIKLCDQWSGTSQQYDLQSAVVHRALAWQDLTCADWHDMGLSMCGNGNDLSVSQTDMAGWNQAAG